jgi:hypothetical protein
MGNIYWYFSTINLLPHGTSTLVISPTMSPIDKPLDQSSLHVAAWHLWAFWRVSQVWPNSLIRRAKKWWPESRVSDNHGSNQLRLGHVRSVRASSSSSMCILCRVSGFRVYWKGSDSRCFVRSETSSQQNDKCGQEGCTCTVCNHRCSAYMSWYIQTQQQIVDKQLISTVIYITAIWYECRYRSIARLRNNDPLLYNDIRGKKHRRDYACIVRPHWVNYPSAFLSDLGVSE